MLYLSKLLKKAIYIQNKPFAKVYDFSVSLKTQYPYLEYLLIKRGGKKYLISADSVDFNTKNNQFITTKDSLDLLTFDDKHFYLVEDLLDKQVIDTEGKRLVRVNDIILEGNGHLKVTGIDIGLSGITRRLGIPFPKKTITIPWGTIEAFDYQTGTVKLKLTKNKLNTLHPAELADILEEVGAKEREGLVGILDIEKAASAIEEANQDTQEAIIEHLPQSKLEKILQKMSISEIADVLDEVNPETFKKIIKLLGSDKARNVQKLMLFPDDVAGGLMQLSYYKQEAGKTIAETLGELSKSRIQPEAIVIVNKDGTLVGQVHANELINIEPYLNIEAMTSIPYFVYEDATFSEIFRKFAQYNLRILPVLDSSRKIMGIITIDALLRRIEEEKEKDESI